MNLIPFVECPQLVRNYCDGFKDLLKPGTDYRCFVALVCAYVFGESNISMIVRYFLFSPSVSALCRFLGEEDVAPKLSRRHRRRILSVITRITSDPGRYQFAIDDTLIPHSGKNMWGVYNWYDHTKNCTTKGHKLLVIGVVDKKRKLFIPIIWEILHRDLSKEIEPTSEVSICHEKAWQVGLRLLDEVLKEGFPKLVFSADSWFFGKEFCDALEFREINYVIEVRSNLIVKKSGNSHPLVSLSAFFAEKLRRVIYFNNKSKFVCERTITIAEFESPLKIIAVANKRNIDDDVFGYYACNQLTWDASKIWGYSRGRWSIEVQFRELKQLFALGGAAVQSKQSVVTVVAISMIALTVIRLQQLANADSNKNQYARPISAGNIVRDLEFISANRSISKLAMHPKTRTIAKFKLRYNQKNLNTKPAEKRRLAKTSASQGKQRKVA